MRLKVRSVSVEVQGHRLVGGVDLDVPEGTVTGVVGPNGAGKSTLLRTVYRALRPSAGAVHVGGDDVWRLRPVQNARRTAAVMQRTPADVDLTVYEMAELGRVPHGGARNGHADVSLVHECLDRVGMLGMSRRGYAGLSGGEQQRVLLARALVQQPRLLVVDEPTNHLDVRHQHDVLGLLRRLEITTLVAIHDLTLAATYCHQVVLMADGMVRAAGPPAESLHPALVREVFAVDVAVLRHPLTGHPVYAFTPPTADAVATPRREEAL